MPPQVNTKTNFRRGTLALLAYLILVPLLAAIICPFLYNVGKSLAPSFAESSINIINWLGDEMQRASFNRYFNRAVLLAAVLLAFPLAKVLRVKNLRELGLEKDENFLRNLLIGFGLGFLLILILGFTLKIQGSYSVRENVRVGQISGAIPTGFTVAFLEEFIFRGVFLGFAIRVFGKNIALIVISFFFALVHFLKGPAGFQPTEINSFAGFELLGKMGENFGNFDFLLANFATLFFAGLILGIVRLHGKSLWPVIGLHAGWIAALRIFNASHKWSGELEKSLPWFGDSLRVGVLSLLTLLLTGWLGKLCLPKKI